MVSDSASSNNSTVVKHLPTCAVTPPPPSSPLNANTPLWAQGRALLTVAEIAALCGVSAKTIQRWVEHEALPCVRLRGAGARAMTFVRPADLEAWLLRHRHDQSEDKQNERTVRLNGRRFVSSFAKKAGKTT